MSVPRRRLWLGAGALAASSLCAIFLRAHAPEVPVPAPFDYQTEDGYRIESIQQATIDMRAGPGTSLVVAQVVEVTPYPGLKDAPRTARSWSDVPEVSAARLAVAETLSGPSAAATIAVHNPPLPDSLDSFANPGVPTRTLRLGEYCIVLCAAETGAVVVDPYKGSVVHLTGPSDPVIALVRRDLAWRARSDKTAVYEEARRVAMDASLSIVDRVAAYSSMVRSVIAARSFDNPQAPLYGQFQQTLVAILKDPAAPQEMKRRAARDMRIDVAKPIEKGSDDEFKLRYLLSMLFDRDREKAAEAGERLYFVCIQPGSGADRSTVRYFPDIIEALETREAQDHATDPARPSIASGVLSNLALAHRRDLSEMQKQTAVVIRKLP